MAQHSPALVAGAAAGGLAGVLLFARSPSLAWQLYGGLMLLLCAAILLAAAQANAMRILRRLLLPARPQTRRWIAHGRVLVPTRARRRVAG